MRTKTYPYENGNVVVLIDINPVTGKETAEAWARRTFLCRGSLMQCIKRLVSLGDKKATAHLNLMRSLR
jgi:hypothetical protein